MNIDPVPFAVDLSNDGIFLWHRKPAKKWEFLGSVPLNSGNLRQQLESLKTIATNVAETSNNAIVRIPTAEVRTLTVPYEPDTEEGWEIRIVSALENASGTSIRELAFDIDRGDGSSDISVAWTPMSVVKQAETFVHLIGFMPTRYTTDVDPADFPRNPSFQLADYQATADDISSATDTPQDDVIYSDPEISPIPEPVDSAPSEGAPPAPTDTSPYNKYSKGDFGFVWFIALFLILALLISAIYFWPSIQQSAESVSEIGIDQPFFAIATDSTQFTLKTTKLSYS